MECKDVFIKLPVIFQIEGIAKGERTKKIFNIFSEYEFKLRSINSDTRPDGILVAHNHDKSGDEILDDFMKDNKNISSDDIILFKVGDNWLMSYNDKEDKKNPTKKLTLEMLNDKWFIETNEIEQYYMDSPLYKNKIEDLGDSAVENYKEYLFLRGNTISNIKSMQTLANLNLGIDLEPFNGMLLFEQPEFKTIISSNQNAMIENIYKQMKDWIVYKDKIYMPTELLCEYSHHSKNLRLKTPEIKNNVLKYKKQQNEKFILPEHYFPLSLMGNLNNEINFTSSYNISIKNIELTESSIIESIKQCILYFESRYHKLGLSGFNNDLETIKQYYELCIHRKNLFENIENLDMFLLYLKIFNDFKNVHESYKKETYLDDYIKLYSTLNKFKQYGQQKDLLYNKNNLMITNKDENDINSDFLRGL